MFWIIYFFVYLITIFLIRKLIQKEGVPFSKKDSDTGIILVVTTLIPFVNLFILMIGLFAIMDSVKISNKFFGLNNKNDEEKY